MAGEKDDRAGNNPHNKSLRETAEFGPSTGAIPSKPLDPSDATAKIDATQVLDSFNRSTVGGVSRPVARTEALPTNIPGFDIERELGRGAFGVVYAAHDQMLDRKVAIKKPIIADPLHRQQYIDEARKAVKLDHPGIVPIYHVGLTDSGEPFVIQKLIEGSTLRGTLKSLDGRLPIDQVVAVMRQVCLAVDAAHAAGIVHRDLKPENLLVEPSGRVYVADFGLAILDEDEKSLRVKEVAGTPLYMSPEQFTGRNDWLDGRSDIWALGVIFYEMLAGKTPFFGKNISELKDEIRNKDPRPLHQRDPSIPAEFDAFFRKCCAKQVAERFATVHEMVAELDRLCAGLGIIPFDWNGQTGSRAFGVASMRGSFLDRSRDSTMMSGGRTQRSMGSTVGGSQLGSMQSSMSTTKSMVIPVVKVVAALLACVATAWFLKLGPFQTGQNVMLIEPVTRPPTPESPSNARLEPDQPKQETKPASVKPEKPFVVSVKGEGTHDSISKALADSDVGETVTVMSGTYRESIVLEKSMSLIGQGEVRILSAAESCLEVRSDSQVVVENINFDCQADERNAVEIFAGRLTLKDCDVFADSPHAYDCVKARSNTVFVADRCNFQSTEHAAIYGDKDSTLALRDCKIGFPGNTDFGLKRCGVQAVGAQGLIRNCVVTGPCVAGIDWFDSPTQSLTIEQSRFENCEIGIQTRQCGVVRIQGTAEQPLEIVNARFGLNIVDSRAAFKYLLLQGTDEGSKVGLQISKGSVVECDESRFVGMRCGVIVHQSKLTADTLTTDDTSFAGLLVDESNVEAEALKIANVQNFGLAVLSTNAHVEARSIGVEARLSNGQELASAIYATSGQVEFGEADFRNCLCGVCVDPDREIIEFVGYPKKTLADLLKTTKRADQPLPNVVGKSLSLHGCEFAWTFAGVGAGKVGQITGDLPASKRVPRLLYPDRLEVDGKAPSDFSVRAKTPK